MDSLVERTRRIAESARVSHETVRERNRREMPETARIVDEFRGMMGHFRGTENGRTVEFGKRVPDAKVSNIPFVNLSALAELQEKYGGRTWSKKR